MSFSDSFWSEDYSTGINALFKKLNQGLVENEEVLGFARRRAELEDAHGQRLFTQAHDSYRKNNGFLADDGATTRKAFEGMVQELEESAACHAKISQNLIEMVVKPFGRWVEEHAVRVKQSEKDLTTKVKAWEKQHSEVKRLRGTYFNKCRLLEEEDGQSAGLPSETGTSGHNAVADQSAAQSEQRDEDEEEFELGDTVFSTSQLKSLFSAMLTDLPMREVKLPILGTFTHVSTGDQITKWISQKMRFELDDSESFGQSLVDSGFLRHLGVGSTFANSSKLQFQWRDKALVLAGKMRPGENSIINRASNMPYVGEYVSTYVPNPVHAGETPLERLKREARAADEAYRTGVSRLDALRTELDIAISEHLKFMERCELDRLKALKAVMMDISAAISNEVPSLKASCDTVVAFQEAVSPQADLRFLVESYRTGTFAPKSVTYDSYYNAVEGVFGVDLELRSRADKKRVPLIVFAILSHMDEHYPDLPDDDGRRRVWLRNVPLHFTYELRSKLNSSTTIDPAILESYDPAIVASVLKLYLLELPDAPIPALSDSAEGIVEELAGLRLSNIATLDALMTHWSRLVELTNAPEEYKQAWAQHLAPCLTRRHDKAAQRFLLELLNRKQEIFTALKKVVKEGKRGSKPEQLNQTESAPSSGSVSGRASDTPASRARPSLTDEIDFDSRPRNAQEKRPSASSSHPVASARPSSHEAGNHNAPEKSSRGIAPATREITAASGGTGSTSTAPQLGSADGATITTVDTRSSQLASATTTSVPTKDERPARGVELTDGGDAVDYD
ncbi:Rho-GTPase-activating protein 8 [Savitreella phatthalungensis]